MKRVNVKIKRGEFLAIFGPSGSGKSTLMHILGCLDRPSKGKLLLDGKDTSKLTDDELALVRRKKVGFVFQQFNLIPSLSALENVELALRLTDLDREEAKERAASVLTSVGLGERLDHRPSQLSGGEQQRVAVARALANNPEIILADEPTGNLDTKTGKEIIEQMRKINKEGFTFIMVTHDMSIARTARRRIQIRDGEIA